MNRDPVKSILDSLLEEVLCELRPPDVTDRVLRALDDASVNSGDAAAPTDEPPVINPAPAVGPLGRHSLTEPPTLAPAKPIRSAGKTASSSDSPSKHSPSPIQAASSSAFVTPSANSSRYAWASPVFWMACGAASVTLVAALSMLILQINKSDSRIADDDSGGKSSNQRMVERNGFPSHDLANDSTPSAENGATESSDVAQQRGARPGSDTSNPANQLRDDSPFREAPPFGRDEIANSGFPSDQGSDSLRLLEDQEIVRFVNFAISREINRQQIMPASRISDRAWVSRVCEVVLGRPASEQETLLFQQAPQDAPREWFAEQLLSNRLYEGEFSRRWGRLLAKHWLKSSSDSTRQLMARFLTESIAQRHGLDQIVASMLTATGSTDPNDEAFNPATALIAAHLGDAKHKRLTGDVARQFLGRRLDCAQCHDHALASEWKQSDFWEMNAFFQQLAMSSTPQGSVTVTDQDFAGESNNIDDAVVFFEDESGELRAAHPRFEGKRFGSSGRVADFHRRQAFAENLVQSNDFRRVIVNRIWAECFHVGFSRPSDELGTHNPVSHPELLQGLADQFAAHDFRLRPLLKWMVLSDPFQRAQADSWDFAMDSPHLGHRPLFSRYYREWSRPDTANEALALVTKQRDALARYEPGMNGILANVPSVPGESQAANPNQSGEQLDTDLANAFVLRTHENPWGVSGYYARLLTSLANHASMPETDRLRHLFQLAVDRDPTATELADAHKLIEYQQQQDPERGMQLGLQDIWWTLMLSDEFYQ